MLTPETQSQFHYSKEKYSFICQFKAAYTISLTQRDCNLWLGYAKDLVILMGLSYNIFETE